MYGAIEYVENCFIHIIIILDIPCQTGDNRHMVRKCQAITKKGKPCPWKVEHWRVNDLCHIHDPDGTFRQQLKNKGYKTNTYKLKHEHAWYMREKGIVCIKCNLVWEPSMG